MNRPTKVALLVAAASALLFAVSLAQYFGKAAVDYAKEARKEAVANQSIEKQLEEAAQNANRQLSSPRVVNEHIQMESVAAGPGKQLTFFYTVHQVSPLSKEQLTKLFETTRDRLCSSNLRQLLDNGATFNYKYRDENARWEKDIAVRQQDCGNNPS